MNPNFATQSTVAVSPTLVVGLFLLGIIFLIIIVINIWRLWLQKNYKLPLELRQVILLVEVPKEAIVGEGQNQNIQISEQISWAENLWSSLGAMKPQSGFKVWLYGRHDEISLEIVAKDKLIFFYVVVPNYLRQYLEQQIQAQFPHAQITEDLDYNIFTSQGSVAAASLKLVKPDIFPIKTFRKMEIDPLNTLTNSLSKLNEDEGAAIQLTVRPVSNKWHAKGKKVVADVMSGKSMSEALHSAVSKTWYDKAAQGTFKAAGSAFKTTEKDQDNQLPKPQPQLSALDQESLKSIEEKSSKAGVEANIRIVSASPHAATAKLNLDNIINSFSQFNIYEYGNGFAKASHKSIDAIIHNFIHRSFSVINKFVLNTEELASVFHFPLPACETPNIHWLGARKASAPVNAPEVGTILGRNIYRGRETLIRLKPEDRMRHTYIIGMTGTGKSVLMENMAKQDIAEGKGVCFVDPHGTAIDRIAPNIPPERLDDVIYFNPADTERPLGLNMLEAHNQQEMDFATQEMIEIFYSLMPDRSMGGPMFEHYMRNALLLLMSDQENPGTLVELPRVFTDEAFRTAKLQKCVDIMVRDFWEKEFTASQKGSMGADMLGYIISKVGRFIENEMMRDIIGQPYSAFDFREVMDQGKILLINLSKGQIGDTNSDLLGLIVVSKLQMAAMARADMPENQRHDFFLYIDEFQNYLTDSISIILSEARKYRLSLNVAHQFIGQLVKPGGDTTVKDAIFGNVGTLIVYRIGIEDAEFLAKQFAPVFNEHDLMNIEKFNAYTRLMIDNQVARPFNVAPFPPEEGNPEIYSQIKQDSRQKYGHPKAEIEADIKKRAKIGETV